MSLNFTYGCIGELRLKVIRVILGQDLQMPQAKSSFLTCIKIGKNLTDRTFYSLHGAVALGPPGSHRLPSGRYKELPSHNTKNTVEMHVLKTQQNYWI